jgi:hypothetical protein
MNPTLTLRLAKFLSKRVANGTEIIKQFPQYRAEYIEETSEYSKVLYQLLKEMTLP